MHSTIYFVAAIAAASANVGSHVRLVITHTHPHYCQPIITYRLLLATNDPLPFTYITNCLLQPKVASHSIYHLQTYSRSPSTG